MEADNLATQGRQVQFEQVNHRAHTSVHGINNHLCRYIAHFITFRFFVICVTLNHTEMVDRAFYNMYILLKRKHS
ncbi:hypothetical protein UMNK88_1765 [Escherichia coli UMNK88]|nr:hypothetical protein UMNK88_1765 [Escherichia coli UMNK88]